MAPTPIVPNGEVALQYNIAGQNHVQRWRCSINNPAGPVPFLLDLFGGGTSLWTTLVAQIDVLLSPLYHPDASFLTWTLYNRVGTNYIPIDSIGSTAVGSASGLNESCGQVTMTFKNSLNQLDKIVILESIFQPPFKASYAAMNASLKALALSYISTTTGNIGQWAMGRNGTPPTRSLGAVGTLNRKIRRNRGLI